MKNDSLAIKGIILAISLASFGTNVFSLFTNSKNWIIVTALIYMLPVVIEIAESLQDGIYNHKLFFLLAVIGVVLGIIYIACIIVYISLLNDDVASYVPLLLRIILIIMPAPCIVTQAYPFGVGIMQLYNRQKVRFNNKNKNKTKY